MALYAIAVSDALAAVYEAKYHYELWRPITAIRSGDDASAASWQPIDNTPMAKYNEIQADRPPSVRHEPGRRSLQQGTVLRP